ncbi:MarR family transcriptional regulator [Weissella cibaria]|uniref:MarR family winged helix-turn-helix transcriptional regulator n=1 Tax=Weissella cibaria TaxID=137591 RepID=UPI0021AECFE9|nr:MarR family transcriptional regulator [Weissella cibaria]MCT0957086.1 MarR family transcriptional regulator [Weissella cibaria]
MELLSQYIDAYLSTLKYLDEVVSEPAADYGLSFEQYLIMHSIADQDGLTLTDVVERRHVTRAAVSRQIKMLLKKEFIYQEPDEMDRRRMLLHLTEAGADVERIVTKRVETRFDGWVESFGEDKAHKVLAFIRQFDDKVVSKTKAKVKARNLE